MLFKRSYGSALDMTRQPGACTCHLSGAFHSTLESLLNFTPGSGGGSCGWTLAQLKPSERLAIDSAQCLIADFAVQWRFAGASQSYEKWKNATNERVKLIGNDRKVVTPFLDHAFGLPEKPRLDIHRRGWLAEFVWFLLAEHVGTSGGRVLRRIEGPDWHATKPGRDGLIIWETASGTLEFRLWESKQYTGAGSISGSVSGATKQLKDHAPEYLAEATAIAAAAGQASDADVRQLCGELVSLWVNNSPKSGIGISVTTSHQNSPNTCFSRVHASFPGLSLSGQIEGLVSAIANYKDFTDEVRDRVWISL